MDDIIKIIFGKVKCSIGIIAISSLLVSSSIAEDFLSKVTNGALSDTSEGVKLLSLEEQKKVVGGYGLMQNDSGQNVFELMRSNLSGATITQIGVVVGLTKYELDNKVACGFGGNNCSTSSYVNKQSYNDLITIANPNLNEYLAVTATKTTTIGAYGVPQNQFTNSAVVVGLNHSNGTIYKIRNVTSNNSIASEVWRRVGNDLNGILLNQY